MKWEDFDPNKSPQGSYGQEPQLKLPEFQIPKINKKVILGAIIVLLLLIFGGSTFYSVGPGERGVIQTFGKWTRNTGPGLHFKFPMGIETLTKVKVDRIFKEEFGFRTTRPGVRSEFAKGDYSDESLMLTGDLGSAVVDWEVQYRIRDPKDFLFNVRDLTDSIRAISEFATREVVGDRSINEVLTVGRREIGLKVHELMQRELDLYGSGIEISLVQLLDVNPPDTVKPSFNEVNEAKQEREKSINQAWEIYNKAIPAATGEADRTIKKAEGYAMDRVNRSKGDANRFLAVWKEYKLAEDVTKRRLYLETLREILPKIGQKYIVDSDQQGILPLLNIDRGGK
ncbi:MAG: FtsH protease activity modulator HflK [Candidatus Tectomicrobia bacterium]|uniref:Protein HflK n=1 Tax=Tectimicrobiota bacterium TaxID=2528274 RepID=A0A933GJC9_UNCTE|nr:FtsH protease activity modulator HflK [Candidatus Tectomicrobia bacterium]